MKNEIITSRSNIYVKKIFSLLNKKGRENSGLFWAEGTKSVDAALNSNKFEVCDIIVKNDVDGDAAKLSKLAEAKGYNVTIFNSDCFNKISALRHPEGIGVVAKINLNAELPEKIEKPITILWQLGNPGNQGAIIRSAAAFGCDTVILVDPCVDEYHPMCIRATSGAFFAIDVLKCNVENIIPWLENQKENVIILTPDGKNKINTVKFPAGKILIIGNEPHGISEKLKNLFDTAAIKMNPNVESLNTSCAASIAMYELWGSKNR